GQPVPLLSWEGLGVGSRSQSIRARKRNEALHEPKSAAGILPADQSEKTPPARCRQHLSAPSHPFAAPGLNAASGLVMNHRVDNHARVSAPDGKQRWVALLTAAARNGTFVKLTLSRPCCANDSLKNVIVRPVALSTGQR